LRLTIKKLQVAGSAGHKEIDHSLGFCGKLRRFRSQRIRGFSARGSRQTVLDQQLTERGRAQPHAALFEEPAPGYFLRLLFTIQMILAIHGFFYPLASSL